MSWVKLDGTDGRLFGRELGGEGYCAASFGSDFTGRTADFLVGSWEAGENSC